MFTGSAYRVTDKCRRCCSLTLRTSSARLLIDRPVGTSRPGDRGDTEITPWRRDESVAASLHALACLSPRPTMQNKVGTVTGYVRS